MTTASAAASAWVEHVVARTVEALTEAADPRQAEPMSAYMRDQFPFLGVRTTSRRAAQRTAWKAVPPPVGLSGGEAAAAVESATRQLWELPQREFQYAAIELLERHRKVLGPHALDTLGRDLITSKSWWDSVDSLRSALIGPLVQRYPELTPTMRQWAATEDRWLIRSAIIHQLGYREATDEELLFELCTAHAAQREFFIAKGIGWALRTHARGRPDAVRAFVASRPELSPLARREALKHL